MEVARRNAGTTSLRAGIAALASVALTVVSFISTTPASAHVISQPVNQIAEAPAATPVASHIVVANVGSSCTYVVRPGDWLSKIGASYGVSWVTLARTNGIANPNYIYVGQQLNVCGGGTAAAAPAAVQTQNYQAAPVSYTATAGEPCQSGTVYAGYISQWAIPPSCYGGVYWINPANYVARGGFGWCNWWPEVLHPNNPNVLFGARHSQPIPGAVVVFAPGEQGASSQGHYGEVVSVLGNGWILISEMNNTWRGAGFGRVDYRYVRVTYGTSFIYG